MSGERWTSHLLPAFLFSADAAKASLIIVTVFAAAGLAALAFKGEVTAAGIALIMGAWAGSDTTILGLYSHFNVKEKNGG